MDESRLRYADEIERERLEPVIATIVGQAESEIDDENGRERYWLRYGSRTLDLLFEYAEPGVGWISDRLERTGSEADSRPQEDTLLYEAAKRLMEQVTARRKQPHEFRYSATSEKMIKWAHKDGRHIFRWDSIEPNDDPSAHRFCQNFQPADA